jgi:hypothetical protein
MSIPYFKQLRSPTDNGPRGGPFRVAFEVDHQFCETVSIDRI